MFVFIVLSLETNVNHTSHKHKRICIKNNKTPIPRILKSVKKVVIIKLMRLATAKYPLGKIDQKTTFLTLALATLLIVMVVSQLMSLDKFIPIIENYQLPGGDPIAKIIVYKIEISALFALPFLLRMGLSPLFRWLSALLLNLHSLIWVALGLWIVSQNPPLIGTGILGGFLKSLSGGVVLPFGLCLLALSLLVTWLLRRDLKLS